MKKVLTSLALTLALAPTFLTAHAAFSDVDEGLYYAAPIAWAVEQGITTGTTETTFSPDALCTRGQIITFLWRAAGSPAPGAGTISFSDVSETLTPHFYKAILWACQTGIIEEGAEFRPSAPCDRGTTMGFLWRYAGSPSASAPASFTDVSPDADYTPAIAWAVEAGITDGTGEATFSPGEPCTRGQIAAFLYRCLNDTAPETPEDPPAAPQEPQEPEENIRPQRTFSGQGKALSLGLDGSEYTSEIIYEAEASVEIYSPYEAVFTVKVPFPLYQAYNYTIRFDNPEKPEAGYLFSFLRWDEAFTDMIPWEGEHNILRITGLGGVPSEYAFTQDDSGDDRVGGVLSRRITFEEGSFTFDRLEGCRLSCEVSSAGL